MGSLKCRFCGKRYRDQQRLDEHECGPKNRFDLALSPVGRQALVLWNSWLCLQGRSAQNTACFAESIYLETFLKFAKFVERSGVDPVNYLQFMVEAGLSPAVWEQDGCLKAYHERGEMGLAATAPPIYDGKGKVRPTFRKELEATLQRAWSVGEQR